MGTLIVTINILFLVVFVFFAFNGTFLSLVTLRNFRKKSVPLRRFTDEELPIVTVQIAVFNEVYVINRAIDAVCRFDYPTDRLEVQVVDDSTDETLRVVNERVAHWKEKGIDIKVCHRVNRREFKAGALREALAQAKGEFVSVFDADFVPEPDFLRNHIHYFTDANVGFVQSIWKHRNENQSLLHRLQALYLDGYLGVEYFARYKEHWFFAFTGTAGTWRREAIESSGDWQGDTLMECLDMSYRAQRNHWRGVHLLNEEFGVASELPNINGFKTQQHRWAKGFTQNHRKSLPKVLRGDFPLATKIAATIHLSSPIIYTLMLMLLLLSVPASQLGYTIPVAASGMIVDEVLFLGLVLFFPIPYVAATIVRSRNLLKSLPYVPALMALLIGISVNQSFAVIEALLGQRSDFVRTPKYGDHDNREDLAKRMVKYKSPFRIKTLIELVLCLYSGTAAFFFFRDGYWISGVSLTIAATGLGFISLKSVIEHIQLASIQT